MINWVQDSFSAESWANWLEKTSINHDTLIESHGLIKADIWQFTVEILNTENKERISLELKDIINISKKILNEIPEWNELEVKLKETLKQFQDEVNQIAKKVHNESSQLMFFNEDVKSIAETILKEPDYETEFYQLLLNLSGLDNSSQFFAIMTIIGDDLNRLFNVDEYNANIFEYRADLTDETFLQLCAEVISRIDEISEDNVLKFKSILFSDLGGKSVFERLMGRKERGLLFDKVMKTIDTDEFNIMGHEYSRRRKLIYAVAYSPGRYGEVCLNEKISSFPEILQKNISDIVNNIILRRGESIESKFSSLSPERYQKWLSQRMMGSTTITPSSFDINQLTRNHWIRAQRQLCSFFGKTQLSHEDLKSVHKNLTEGEKDVKNPGKYRFEIEGTGIVRTSGGWTHTYCPKPLLKENMDAFLEWFNQSLIDSQENKINTIIFAAKTYQLCVSLHPFENGNGRISRLMMDFVFESSGLLPPILGKDVLDAVFPLDPIDIHVHVGFINKIVKGILESKTFLKINSL